jgi:hypothetical protein
MLISNWLSPLTTRRRRQNRPLTQPTLAPSSELLEVRTLLSTFYAGDSPSPSSPTEFNPDSGLSTLDSGLVSDSGLSPLDSGLSPGSGRSTLPELPGLTLVDPATDVSGQIIFLNFDGAQDVIYNGPVTVGPFDVPTFEAPGDLAGQEEAIIASVVEQLEHTYAGSGVIFTIDQPLGVGGSTIYIGGDNTIFDHLGGEFRGLAETIDIGNMNKSDEALVFAYELDSFVSTLDASKSLASVIGHEAGHLLGMRHSELRDAASIEDYASSLTVSVSSSGSIRRDENGNYAVRSSDPNTLTAGQNDVAVNSNDRFVRGYAVFDIRNLPTDADISRVRLEYDLDVDSGTDPDHTTFWVEIGPLTASKSTWDGYDSESRWRANYSSFYARAYKEQLSNDDDGG